MGRTEAPSGLNRNASGAVIWPLADMVGGLIIGALRAGRSPAFDIAEVERIIKWGVTGFFAGLGLVLLLALQFRRRDVVSIRRLMALIAVAALVAWFFARVFFGAIGYEGF
jgi:hypothetical protein